MGNLIVFLFIVYWLREPLGQVSGALGEGGKALFSLGCVVAIVAFLMALAGGGGLLLGG